MIPSHDRCLRFPIEIMGRMMFVFDEAVSSGGMVPIDVSLLLIHTLLTDQYDFIKV